MVYCELKMPMSYHRSLVVIRVILPCSWINNDLLHWKPMYRCPTMPTILHSCRHTMYLSRNKTTVDISSSTTQFVGMTFQLIMMHYLTEFGCKRLRSAEDIFQTKPEHMVRRTQWFQYKAPIDRLTDIVSDTHRDSNIKPNFRKQRGWLTHGQTDTVIPI